MIHPHWNSRDSILDSPEGREAEARRHWSQALKLAPGLGIAQANLNDLRRPVEERHAPWPFDFPNWVPRAMVDALAAHIEAEGVQSRSQEFNLSPCRLDLRLLLLAHESRGHQSGQEPDDHHDHQELHQGETLIPS